MTPAEFAQLATGHLRARGMGREIRFDEARFTGRVARTIVGGRTVYEHV